MKKLLTHLQLPLKPFSILTFSLFFLTLTACGDDSLHVDLQNELNVRPMVSLQTEDGKSFEGFDWSYCTDVVCFNKDPINFSALDYQPYKNGENLVFTVTFSDPVSFLNIKTYNKTGEVTHRELPYTSIDGHTFLLQETFPNDETEIALNIKVDFTNKGLAHYFFPLKLE